MLFGWEEERLKKKIKYLFKDTNVQTLTRLQIVKRMKDDCIMQLETI